jgi:putative tryptophan/tyrosine transport system substrate-binding protein
MRRREFITLIGGAAAAWPLTVRAQQAKVAVIGALYVGFGEAESFQRELRAGMLEQGYVEGRDVAFEFRSAEGKLDRLPGLAAELVRHKVDVIVALYVPCALAAKQATQDIPIIVLAGEPVETGIVPSLAHPGGNITGVALMASASNGKSVELFKDMFPKVKRVGVLGHSTSPIFAKAMLDEVRLAGGPTGIEIKPVVMVTGTDQPELENAFAAFVSEQVDAIVVQGSLPIKPVTDLAIKHHIPTSGSARVFAENGGLLSFGADGPSTFRHGARFVGRILQGKLPRDIPIEQPTKFDLAVNLKTAKAIGVTIPETFLLRADAAIE